MKRRLRTRFDLLKPNLSMHVASKYDKLFHSDKICQLKSFSVGEKVYVKNHKGSFPKWFSAVIVECKGSKSYIVQFNNKTRLFHVDDIRKQNYNHFNHNDSMDDSQFGELCIDQPCDSNGNDLPQENISTTHSHVKTDQGDENLENVLIRKSGRLIKKPSRLIEEI